MATFYQHFQHVTSATWTINYNLGCKPKVGDMIDTGGSDRTKILPKKVHHVDNDTVKLTLLVPYNEFVHLVGVRK